MKNLLPPSLGHNHGLPPAAHPAADGKLKSHRLTSRASASGLPDKTHDLARAHVWTETPVAEPIVVLRLPALLERIGLSRATVYAMLDEKHPSFDATFPRSIRLNLRSMGWVESEIRFWLEQKIANSRTRSEIANVVRQASSEARHATR